MFQTFTITNKVTVNIMHVAVHFGEDSFFFFLRWTTFKVFIEFVTILFVSCFVFLAARQIMWDLNSLTRD